MGMSGELTHRKKTEVDVARLWRGDASVVHDEVFREGLMKVVR